MNNESAGSEAAGKRAAARAKARELRIGQKRKDRRNRRLLQGGIVVASLLIVGAVVFTIMAQIQPERTGPVNMLSDGIKIGEAFVAETTPGLQPGMDPVPFEPVEGTDVFDIRVYLDYQCPTCRAFEETNHEQLAAWLESGAATLEVHPIALLDRQSLGMRYSTRAANAAACVANYSPNQFFDYNSLLFASQPKSGTEGLTDDQLFALAERADVKSATLIETCIDDENYKAWVNDATARAIAGPIPNSNVDRVANTPTVIVNGVMYDGPVDDAVAFATFANTSAGNAFTEKFATETPTPTPAPAS